MSGISLKHAESAVRAACIESGKYLRKRTTPARRTPSSLALLRLLLVLMMPEHNVSAGEVTPTKCLPADAPRTLMIDTAREMDPGVVSSLSRAGDARVGLGVLELETRPTHALGVRRLPSQDPDAIGPYRAAAGGQSCCFYFHKRARRDCGPPLTGPERVQRVLSCSSHTSSSPVLFCRLARRQGNGLRIAPVGNRTSRPIRINSTTLCSIRWWGTRFSPRVSIPRRCLDD